MPLNRYEKKDSPNNNTIGMIKDGSARGMRKDIMVIPIRVGNVLWLYMELINIARAVSIHGAIQESSL